MQITEGEAPVQLSRAVRAAPRSLHCCGGRDGSGNIVMRTLRLICCDLFSGGPPAPEGAIAGPKVGPTFAMAIVKQVDQEVSARP